MKILIPDQNKISKGDKNTKMWGSYLQVEEPVLEDRTQNALNILKFFSVNKKLKSRWFHDAYLIHLLYFFLSYEVRA